MKYIFMASLGCAKNLVDAETMLGETLGEKYGLAIEPEQADVIVINTCGFIQDARDEARQVIEEFLQLKKTSRKRLRVAAAGCWASREPEQVRREFPGLDAIWGLDIPSSLADHLDALFRQSETAGGKGEETTGATLAGLGHGALPREGARLVTTLPSYAYLRLSDGCDNCCSYCAIPLIRGPLRSRKPEDVLEEARLLEDQGASELVLISQDTTAYGMDLKQPGVSLAALLEQLLKTVSIPRLRLLYAHPAHLDDTVMAMLAGEKRLCHYLDLPIQHASDDVLRRMNRGYGKDRIDAIVSRLATGGVTLRTTLLLGFPGETEEDFRQVTAVVESGAFRHIGAFAYSPEPGTPAYDDDRMIPAEEAERRRDAVLRAQANNAFAWLDSRVGKTESLLVDSQQDAEWFVARSSHEAPDADNVIYLRSTKVRPGDMVMACITGRDGYDLLAETRKTGGKRGRARGKR